MMLPVQRSQSQSQSPVLLDASRSQQQQQRSLESVAAHRALLKNDISRL